MFITASLTDMYVFWELTPPAVWQIWEKLNNFNVDVFHFMCENLNV